jgi:hypothetical protein
MHGLSGSVLISIFAVRQLNGIAVQVLAIAETKDFSLPYLTKTRAAFHQRFPQGRDILGVEDNLRTLRLRDDGPECSAIVAPRAANSRQPSSFVTCLRPSTSP